jgi:hypothetical protein
MSEYYLADIRARERERLREQQLEADRKQNEPKQAQEVKITLLGDFLFQTKESQGFDPYNATNGKAVRDAWKNRRDRR